MSKEAVSMCKAVRTTIHHCQPLIIPFDFIYIGVIMRVPHWNREGLLVITAFISKCLPFNMLYLSLQSNFSFPVMCKFTSPCMFIFAGTWCNFISSFSDLNLFFLQFWISKIFIFERILKELLMKQLELFLYWLQLYRGICGRFYNNILLLQPFIQSFLMKVISSFSKFRVKAN